ncbi:hypothetical protein ASG67_12375 [Sphingomonas sp. Leaf339]|uniref:hypothetical protein n=1 Tax=Sphingomonas sp. Leaf339 TaxID=1736343 RepID=UPI0006F95D66|nr:hypothetical protein [Sphingomonas sp. Leaf339]KQU48131.1 hypothetical protein ASG67_12375 [Sphingomonas sp. Leaf339]
MRWLAIGFTLLSLSVEAQAQFKQHSLPGDRPPPNSWSSPRLPVERAAGPTINDEVADVRQRVDTARDNGALSKREARGLRRETASVGLLASMYGENGLSDAERRELDGRMQVVRDNVVITRTRAFDKNNGSRGR